MSRKVFQAAQQCITDELDKRQPRPAPWSGHWRRERGPTNESASSGSRGRTRLTPRNFAKAFLRMLLWRGMKTIQSQRLSKPRRHRVGTSS